MNADKQRIAIAKACGWKWKKVKVLLGDIADSTEWETGWVSPEKKYVGDKTHFLPDYLNNLNAIHGALLLLDDWTQGAQFDNHLFRVLHRRLQGEGVSSFSKIRAEAAELSEAFLKTLNLWAP